MKPWEREVNEIEKFFVKTQEAENQKFNTQQDKNDQNNETLAFI